MESKKWLLVLVLALVISLTGGFFASAQAAAEKMPKVGPVKLNAHPANLEGKTVLLRWNEKMNGDKYLTRVGELLTQQAKNVKIIKLWEVDKSTAAISKDLQASEQTVATIAKLKPDLVIAVQAD